MVFHVSVSWCRLMNNSKTPTYQNTQIEIDFIPFVFFVVILVRFHMFHTLNNHMIMVMICFCFFIINRIYRLCFLSAHNQLQCEHIVYKHCYTLRFSVYALTISIVIDNEISG